MRSGLSTCGAQVTVTAFLVTRAAVVLSQETTQSSTLSNQCRPESDAFWDATNTFEWSACAFCLLGIIASSCVLAVIFAHHKDRRSMNARILVGLFISNIAYAFGLGLPSNTTWGCSGDRREFVFGDTMYKWQAVGGAFFYAGNFWTVLYELFVVVASLYTLVQGTTSLPTRIEKICHIVCVSVGFVVFIVFFVKGLEYLTIYFHDYGTHTASGAQRRYRDLESQLVQGWVAFLLVVLLAFMYQRWYLRKLEHAWTATLEDAEKLWDKVLWDQADEYTKQMRQKKKQLLDMQREAYLEIAKPLEWYIVCFVLFSIPSVVIATQACAEQSAKVAYEQSGVQCINICYEVLAFRPLALGIVFFRDSQSRQELLAGHELRHKLWNRTINSFAWIIRQKHRSGRVRFGADQVRTLVDVEDDEHAIDSPDQDMYAEN